MAKDRECIDYACECIRLAGLTDDAEIRDRLGDGARLDDYGRARGLRAGMRGSEYYPDIMLRYVAIGQTARPAELNGLRQESPLHPLAILSLVSQCGLGPAGSGAFSLSREACRRRTPSRNNSLVHAVPFGFETVRVAGTMLPQQI
jgi:hypothetical protein